MKLNSSNTFVIGDVHGCFYTLQKLVKSLPKNANLIFVGDLCDKGLWTKEVISFIIANDYKCVLGNHDVHMILNLENALNGKDSTWNKSKIFSGDKTVKSYKNDIQLAKKHILWLKTLPHFIELDRYLITHGFGLPFYKSSLDRREFYMRVNRISKEQYNELYDDNWQEYKIINIFGHDAFDKVQIGKNYYAIDTNVKNGNRLTAIELGSMNIVSVTTDKRDLAYE